MRRTKKSLYDEDYGELVRVKGQSTVEIGSDERSARMTELLISAVTD